MSFARQCPPASSRIFPLPPEDTFSLERLLYQRGYTAVAGLDEAGRGPLAGPVLAACVILPPDCEYALFKDSKQLSAKRREDLFELLYQNGAVIGVGSANPREIEQLNILQASLLAMRRAMEECMVKGRAPDYLLVDGKAKIPVALGQQSLIKGESKSASIASASIIAKVQRDHLMLEAHRQYPEYGFDRHQGYPTLAHKQAIKRHGPCPLHRRTFRGVREFCAEQAPPPGKEQRRLW